MRFYNGNPVCHPAALITKPYVGHRVVVYNGKLYQNFLVSRFMVGTKFGCYVKTTRMGASIHATKKNQKQQQKRKK